MLAAHHHAFDDSLAAIKELVFYGRLPDFRGHRSRDLRIRHLVRAGLSRPLAEALDLAARVHDPLRAGEERVADRADFRLELLARRPGRERVPAHAGDDRIL